MRTVTIAGLPPRRLAMVDARDAQLSLADQAVRDSVRNLVGEARAHASSAAKKVRSRTKRGVRSMAAANPPHDDGRKVNVKLIVVGLFVALLVVFALLNTARGGGRLRSSTPSVHR